MSHTIGESSLTTSIVTPTWGKSTEKLMHSQSNGGRKTHPSLSLRRNYNDRVEALRQVEYPMLSSHTYLDHAGMTIPAKSLIDNFARIMSCEIFGNPHSSSDYFQVSPTRIEDIRLRVLHMFKADPAHFDLVFVANATAGVKLVTEALRSDENGFNYLYHQSSHTSLVGLREEAQNSICLDTTSMDEWLNGGSLPFSEERQSVLLLSFPAQSNLDGTRLPLQWSARHRMRENATSSDGARHLTLLDAAAYVSTTPLDFSNASDAPDFTVLSFYKIFGFPDLGALIVRRQAAHVLLQRRYFGGGTVESVTCEGQSWHAQRNQSVHEALEDGTLPIHSIIALDVALDTCMRLFYSMEEISSHTSFLNNRLHDELGGLRHGNGVPVCVLYSRIHKLEIASERGAIASFNLLSDTGRWVSPSAFQKVASLKGFHVRTGGVCNPGGISRILGLSSTEVRENYLEGYRCGDENDILRGKPTGVIRVSLGAMSTLSDIDKFTDFLREFYTSAKAAAPCLTSRDYLERPRMFIKSIVVYPIKSCRGFQVPPGQSWIVRPEGLIWDREWCLMNRATNRIMTQKRYPSMALLQPHINVGQNMMTIYNCGSTSKHSTRFISIPLCPTDEVNGRDVSIESLSATTTHSGLAAYVNSSKSVNDFFSIALGTPCMLARSCRPERSVREQKLQESFTNSMPGSFPEPPESWEDTVEHANYNAKSLSNESPILAINQSSVMQLNEDIEAAGGRTVSAESFRANLVLGLESSSTIESAYSEDGWSKITIGSSIFRSLGPCQRCHMVCIDPKTAIKQPEPYVTLSKTRRFDEKVYFGVHLTLVREELGDNITEDVATLTVGDKVKCIQQS